MSVPIISDKDPDEIKYDALKRLLSHKEFYQYKADPERNFRYPQYDPLEGKYLKLQSHQLFDSTYINPNTKNKGLFVVHTTGTGKTFTGLAIALNHVHEYKRIYQQAALKLPGGKRSLIELDKQTPSVFVLGWAGTKNAFIRDLLKYPDFGFISLDEKEELLGLQRLAMLGLPADIKRYRDYYNGLRKRLINKQKGGFFKMLGYQEFVNRLFIFSKGVSLTSIELMVRSDPKLSFEDVIYQFIREGKIDINEDLVKSFKNSLFICDEIHNTYNMNMKNNYGVAIQFALNTEPTAKGVFMSATLLNNSPAEIVDVLNYALDQEHQLQRKDLFVGKRTLLPDALSKITSYSLGKVSFLQDTNIRFYPERVFEGEVIDLTKFRNESLEDIPFNQVPYFKFVRCVVSDYHRATYDNWFKLVADKNKAPIESAEQVEQELGEIPHDKTVQVELSADLSATSTEVSTEELLESALIPPDGYYIYDMVFPNPQSSEYGLFRSSEIRAKLYTAPQDWKDANGVVIKKVGTSTVISGDFMLRENISKYTTKYAKMLDILKDLMLKNTLASTSEKTFIYHERVKISGVITIQEILRMNGFLDEFTEATDMSLCALCGETLSHKAHTSSIIEKTEETEIEGSGENNESKENDESSTDESDTDESDSDESNDSDTDDSDNATTKLNKRAKHLGKSQMKQMGCMQKVITRPWNRARKMAAEHDKKPREWTPHPRKFAAGDDESADTVIRENGILLPHAFVPARFVSIHGEMDKAVLEQSIDKYNAPNNAHGHKFMILIGSKIIKESRELKDTQNLILTTVPVNVSAFRQIIGRCIRKNSHINLLPEYRKVRIYTLVGEFEDSISPELRRWIEKCADYLVIQEIERAINKGAVDADIHRDIIMSKDILSEYFPSAVRSDGSVDIEATKSMTPQKIFGSLYFEQDVKMPVMDLSQLNLSTFNAYKYFEKEIAVISYIIKRLFISQSVWKYEDLWSKVREPPYALEMNPKLFAEDNFIIALNHLSSRHIDVKQEIKQGISEEQFIYSLFDYNNQYIYKNGIKHLIEKVSPYYILFPVLDEKSSILSGFSKQRVLKDIDTYSQPYKYGLSEQKVISLEKYIIQSKKSSLFDIQKRQFQVKYSDPNSNILEFLEDYNVEFYNKLLELIISNGITSAYEAGSRSPKKSLDKEHQRLEQLHKRVIDLFDQFRIIITVNEVKKYKDVLKQFKSDINRLEPDTAIGYLALGSIRLYDYPNWIESSKVSMNKQVIWRENDIIIGYLEEHGGKMKFKIRKPVHQLKRGRLKKRAAIISHAKISSILQRESHAATKKVIKEDTRLIERGIVCSTKSKGELLYILRNLNVRLKYDPEEIKIKNLCDEIKNKLIELEMKERQKDTRIKWFYLFNEALPSLAE